MIQGVAGKEAGPIAAMVALREAGTAAEVETQPAAGQRAMGSPQQGVDWAIQTLVGAAQWGLRAQKRDLAWGPAQGPAWAVRRASAAALESAPWSAPCRGAALHMQHHLFQALMHRIW